MAFAVLLAFSCQRDELRDEAVRTVKTLKVGVADESQTKVGFDDNNAFYWHAGDRIAVLTTAGFKVMTIDPQYDRQATGVFTGEFAEDIGDYAVYPYGDHVMDESGQLVYILPASYTYTSIEDGANSFNPPMVGKIGEGTASLAHVGSFFRISVSNIPAGGDDMKFIFTADRRITGEFVIDLSAETPVMTTDDQAGNTVTIDFSNDTAGSEGVFYIPAPLGTYGTITAEVRDGEVSLAGMSWTDQTVSRKTPKRGSMSVDYVATVNGTIYKTFQEALDAADGQTITIVKDLVLDSPVVVAQGNTVALDLGGNTLSGVATSAAASSLFTVRSGGDLTISNGTVSFAATTPDTQWGGEGQPPYPGYANNTISNSGTLTIENAVLENRTSKGGASYVIDNYSGAKLTINEGSVITQSGGDIAIRMFNGGSGAVDVTINGGTITGARAVWIQLASTDTAVAPVMNLTVTGGTLTSSDTNYQMAVYSYSYGNDMKNVTINVSGGTFNGDIALTGGSNKTNIETMNISGGTFNGPWGFYSYGDFDKSLETIKVSGGTYLEDPTDYLATGYVAVQADGKWVVSPAG